MVSASTSRRLAAIMALDVAGYSRLMEQDEEATFADLGSHLNDLIKPNIAAHNGRVVKLMGDGVLAEFASPVDAVRCASQIQADMPGRNSEVPAERRMDFRIGINLGDVIAEEDDIFGDGVNVAARLEGIADSGGICISGSVFDQVDGKLDCEFDSLGAKTVKNISKPVRVYKVLIDRNAAPAPPAQTAAPASYKASIAVLPFENLSRDPEQEFFSDGLSESLITTLSKAPGLFVIARSSTFVYKDQNIEAQRVAKELGVRFVLQGSIQRLGNRVRINAQLIDGDDGHHVWAERYDRIADDFFLLQDDITFNILTACQVQLTEGEAAKIWLLREGPPNLPAIELHWQALEKFRKFNAADNAAARQLWERSEAMMEAPDVMVRAYIAYTHAMDAKANWSEDREASLARAGEITAEANQLDGRNYLVKLLEATIAQVQGQCDISVELARQAVEIHPGSADSHYVLGIQLNYAGYPEQAAGAIGMAMRLSPFYPTNYLYQMGISKFLLGQFDEAVDIFEQCRSRSPNSRSNYVWLATVHADSGSEAQAQAAARRALELDPDVTIESWLTTEPFADPGVIERITRAMQRAGFVREQSSQ